MSRAGQALSPAGAGIAAAIVVVTLALRLPFLETVGEDEAFFILVARNWLDGVVPYRDLFDVKPPGLFLLVAGAVALAGPNLVAIKLLMAACVATAAFGLHLIARRHVSDAVALWAPFAFVFATLFESGLDSPTLLIQAPFVVFAFLAVARGFGGAAPLGLGRLLGAGVLIGAAGMIKQTAVFEALAILGVLGAVRPARDWPRLALAFGAGALVVPGLFAAYFWAVGALAAAVDGAVLAALGRLAGDALPAAEGAEAERIGYGLATMRLLPLLRPLLPFAMLSLLAWMRHRLISARIGSMWLRLTLPWFAAALLGVWVSKAMLDSYMHTLVAPAALASGVLIAHGLKLATARGRRMARIGLAAVCVLAPPWLEHRPMTRGAVDMVAIRRAAAALREAGAKPGDAVVAVSRGSAIYPESGLFPHARFVNPGHLLCDFPMPEARPVTVMLASRPRFLLVGDARVQLVCQRADRWAAVEAALAADYVPRASIAGVWDRYNVYERRPSADAR